MPLPYEQLVARIRAGEVAPAYLLHGEDLLQQRAVLAALAERLPEIGRQTLDGTSCAAADVVGALRTRGLLPGRLVVVEDPRWVLPPRRTGARRDGGAAAPGDAGEEGVGPEADDAEAGGPGDGDDGPLLTYLERPAQGAVLVLRTAAAVDRRRRLAKRLASRGVVLATVPPAPADAARWMRARARDHGLVLDDALWERLTSRLHGASCERMENELAKLAAWASAAPLDAQALDRLLPPTHEERVFDLLDAVTLDQGARALGIAAALRAQGEPVPLLLYLLAKHLRTLVLVADACRGGGPPEAAAARLGLHPYVARKAWQQGRRFSPAALAASWQAVWEAEVFFKSGRLDDDRALDHALLGVLQAQRPAPSPAVPPRRGPTAGAIPAARRRREGQGDGD